MISGYREEKDTIYLYVDFSYEFAKGVVDKKHPKGFMDQIKEYFERLNIRYRGKRIVLVSNGIIVGSLLLGGFLAGEAKLNEQVLLNSTNSQSPVLMVDQNILPKNDFEEFIKLPKEPTVSNQNQETTSTTIQKPATQTSQIKTEKPQITTSSKQPTTNKTQQTIKPVTSTIEQNKNQASSLPITKPIENKIPNISQPIEEKTYVTLQRSDGTIEKLELEEYLVGVVAAEMPASFHKEALKAQAVAARTYTLKRLSKNLIMTDDTSTQVYKDKEQLQKRWGNNFSFYYNRIKDAVLETKGQTIRYQGAYIDAVYHSMSNGRTEDAKNVWGTSIPYLKSVESPGDIQAKDNTYIVQKDIALLNKLIGLDIKDAVLSITKNESDRVQTVSFNDIEYSGVQFRSLLGLRSSDFTLEIIDDQIKITTKGYGHGVGLSQYGANAMAKEGSTYTQILKHYYRGVSIQ